MPSIQDFYNKLEKAVEVLEEVQQDLKTEQADINGVKASIDTVDATLTSGFSTLEDIDTKTAKLLLHLTEQADTMICALEKISKNTCDLVTQSTIQTALQTRIRDDANTLRNLTESAHPEAALQLERLDALRTQIEKCCPPTPEPPACTYQPCPAPKPIEEADLSHV